MGYRYLAGLQLLQFILFVMQSMYGLLKPKGYAPNLPRVHLTNWKNFVVFTKSAWGLTEERVIQMLSLRLIVASAAGNITYQPKSCPFHSIQQKLIDKINQKPAESYKWRKDWHWVSQMWEIWTVSFYLLNVTSPPVREILLLEVLGTLASLEKATQSHYQIAWVQRKVLLLPTQNTWCQKYYRMCETNYYSTLLFNAKVGGHKKFASKVH